MGTKRNVNMSATTTKVKIVKPTVAEEEKQETKVKKSIKHRSKKYIAVASKVDKTKHYDLDKAIELVKKLNYTKFDGTITAHLVVKDIGLKFDVKFPHSTGKKLKVAIVDDEVIKKIEQNQIDFDVLLCHPKDIKKIVKYARVLGPKGLMPNPKNGTLTTNPELKKQQLESGSVSIKTERKAPLIHVNIGKVSDPIEDLKANLEALIKTVKGKLVKLSIAGTMSPGIKVKID